MQYEQFKKYNMLFVEDDKSIRDESVKLFSLLFNNVYSACDGKDGYEQFASHSNIDLIVSNINMPNLNGIEMVRSIRDKSDIPVVFSTGNLEDEIKPKIDILGNTTCFIKPLDTFAVLEEIRKILLKS